MCEYMINVFAKLIGQFQVPLIGTLNLLSYWFESGTHFPGVVVVLKCWSYKDNMMIQKVVQLPSAILSYII